MWAWHPPPNPYNALSGHGVLHQTHIPPYMGRPPRAVHVLYYPPKLHQENRVAPVSVEIYPYVGSERIWNLTPRGPSMLNMPPMPSTTSSVRRVCFQYSYCL